MYLPPRRRRTSRRLRCWPTTWACSLCSASPRACPKQRTPSPRPPEVLADAPGEASPPLHVTPPPVGRGIVNESAVGWISLPVPLLIAIGAHTLRTQLCPSLKNCPSPLPLLPGYPLLAPRRAREPHTGDGGGGGGMCGLRSCGKKTVLCTPGGRARTAVGARTRWAAACARALCGAQTARCGGGRVCGRPLPPCYQSSCASSILSYATGYLISLSSLLSAELLLRAGLLAADRCARASRPVVSRTAVCCFRIPRVKAEAAAPHENKTRTSRS